MKNRLANHTLRSSFFIYLLLLMVNIGCGCLLGSGGDTTRADRLNHVHKEVGFGIGGPGWWALKRLGTSLSEDENRAATLAIRGVKSVQVSRFTLDQSSEAHRAEFLTSTPT